MSNKNANMSNTYTNTNAIMSNTNTKSNTNTNMPNTNSINKTDFEFDDNLESMIGNFNDLGTSINSIKSYNSLDLNNFINNLKENPDTDPNDLLEDDMYQTMNGDMYQTINQNFETSNIVEQNSILFDTKEFDFANIKVKYLYDDDLDQELRQSQEQDQSQEQRQSLNIYSGPYEYKLCFEDKSYPHSVNLNKLIFNYKINDNYYSKILYLSTGHSFANLSYITDQNLKIFKTDQIEEIFNETNKNLFYSLDKGFDDFALIDFGEVRLNKSNKLNFDKKLLNVCSICKNMDIKFLENETFIKNGNNIGETWAKTLINFQTDNYIKSNTNDYTFYTFKINGKIVIVQTKYSSGIVLKGTTSKISKYNWEPASEEKNNEVLEFYFSNILKEFSNHEIFNGTLFDDNLYSHYTNYRDSNCISIVSLMGDSGSGFYRIIDNDNIEFVGINIGSCSLLVLKQSDKKYPNKIMWNNNINKLVFGSYIIEEVHKSCQMLPVDQIENLIKRNLSYQININEITV